MAKKPLLFISKHEKLLRTHSEPVKKVNSEVKQLIQDLKDTMDANPGVGLAAVQIGVLKRVFLVCFGYYDEPEEQDGQEQEHEAKPVAIVNPEIIESSEEMERGFDGCLSIPGMMGYTDRHKRIKVRYLDETGKKVERTLEGWDARMFEHEYDHLEGILYLDRLKSLEDLYVLTTGPDGKQKQTPYLKVVQQAQKETAQTVLKDAPIATTPDTQKPAL